MLEIGRLNKLVDLQRVTRVATADGFTEVWTTYASRRAAIEPATPHSIEAFTSATITTPVTHLVTMPFVADLSGADRVFYEGRGLYIAGVQNPSEDSRWLVLACEER